MADDEAATAELAHVPRRGVSLYLLDADVVIDLFKQVSPAITLLRRLEDEGHILALSSPVIAEVASGLSEPQREAARAVLLGYPFLDTPSVAGFLAGELRDEIRQRGRMLCAPDALIAATALHHGATLVTATCGTSPSQG